MALRLVVVLTVLLATATPSIPSAAPTHASSQRANPKDFLLTIDELPPRFERQWNRDLDRTTPGWSHLHRVYWRFNPVALQSRGRPRRHHRTPYDRVDVRFPRPGLGRHAGVGAGAIRIL
jgi:hypothetical protein